MRRVSLLLVALALLLAGPSFGQGNPTGKITGTVTTGSDAIPGVTVTVSSDSLQQDRQIFTQDNGSYVVPALPPGRYRLTFELEGMETVFRDIEVSVATVRSLNVDMQVQSVSETIDVVGERAAISETTERSDTLDQALVEKLPVARNINSAVSLAPGVSNTGPNGNASISGAQSFENLYLINGVPVNENLRGQASDLFIEDAIEETTVTLSGVSAEYGRFTGGVVNTVTKRGGNQFSGSIRDNLTNEKWASQTPSLEAREDSINDTFEATLGGFLKRDTLWFFLAGRSLERTGTAQTFGQNVNFPTSTEETRLQGTLTYSITPSHQLYVSALELEDDRTGNVQGTALDVGAVNDEVAFPEESFAFNYTGIMSDRLLLEAQYSERSLEFVGLGGTDSNRNTGTPFRDALTGGAQYHNPIFCGNCPNPDTRETEHTIIKGSYFLSTANAGNHDFTFGIDTFNDMRAGDNTQSATEHDVWSNGVVFQGERAFPIMTPGSPNSVIIWRPILQSSLGSELVSNSLYVNDRWQLGDKWSLNLGLRYDENDGEDSAGNIVAEDDNISPRLGVSYDVKGDGDLVFNASAARYVTRVAGSVANGGSAAGNPAAFIWQYNGPAINTDPNGPFTDPNAALDIIFNWFDSIGGTDNRDPNVLIFQRVPGATNRVDGSLNSPSADEFTIGVSKRLGSRGLIRADYIHREFGDFYLNRIDTTTGTVLDGNGRPADLGLIQNNDSLLERVYDGVVTSFRYRLTQRFNLGGNYTWSHARGNFNGETARSGPVSGTLGQYPEFNAFAENAPRGDLAVDQRNKARAWLLWDVFSTEHHNLNVSLLQNYFSGQPYGAVGAVNTRNLVANPGYVTPPSSVTYFFTGRDTFKTDDITRTDISVNYSFLWNAFGRSMEVFLQPEVLNVFNEDGVVGLNTSDVQDATTSANFATFNPFTEQPVRGVHWDLGPNFGQPRNAGDYQLPRTFRMSVGFRF